MRALMQLYADIVRLWWNWQTRYFEVVVEQSVQVQVLPWAPLIPANKIKIPPHGAILPALLIGPMTHTRLRAARICKITVANFDLH